MYVAPRISPALAAAAFELAATITGVSQAAVSKALRTLGSVATDARAGSLQAAEQLWDRFLAEYPGPRGITTNWYSLDPPTHQPAQVHARHPEALISGDAGADELAPWRAIQRAKMYAATGLELAELGFAEADPADATDEAIAKLRARAFEAWP